jgi:DNA-binding PadR family transcriptional regulator
VARRPSPQTIALLTALAADPAAWRHGYDLCAELDMKAGTLYPILMRLSDRGLLEHRWQADPPPGRPARHLYRLTGEGREYAAVARSAAGAAGRARAAQARLDGAAGGAG